MVAKVKMNSSIGATIGYCCKGEELETAEVVLSNGTTDELNARKLIQQFEDQAAMKPDLKNKVMHIILSHSPDDAERIKGKETEILNDYIDRLARGKGANEGLNLNETQFVVIKHKDKAHTHYHILANMVDNEGNRLKDSNIGYKAKSASIDITKQHDLTPAISQELRQKRTAIRQEAQKVAQMNPFERFIYDTEKKYKTKISNQNLELLKQGKPVYMFQKAENGQIERDLVMQFDHKKGRGVALESKDLDLPKFNRPENRTNLLMGKTVMSEGFMLNFTPLGGLVKIAMSIANEMKQENTHDRGMNFRM